ncbi:hypothetical protein [Burkholderia dolosa]|uniref:hypothetical protein n=1 Tax=Burkholderia dolosa TaxID=152500 RepID=UPI0027D2E7C4|nr:hypothetical protein [Burkholderia dolosa]
MKNFDGTTGYIDASRCDPNAALRPLLTPVRRGIDIAAGHSSHRFQAASRCRSAHHSRDTIACRSLQKRLFQRAGCAADSRTGTIACSHRDRPCHDARRRFDQPSALVGANAVHDGRVVVMQPREHRALIVSARAPQHL